MDKFLDYFYGSEFPKNSVIEDIIHRCFELTGANVDQVYRILGGVETYHKDISAVQLVGWWNNDNNHLISALFKNICLESLLRPNPNEEMIALAPGKFEENSVLVITEGFFNMHKSDFECLKNADSMIPIEDALSYRWSQGVLRKFTGVTLMFRETSEHRGYVDILLSGYASCAIEFIQNATRAQPGKRPQSTDIDEHLARLTSGKYNGKRFFIVNFSIERNEPVLPRDKKYHDIVFTYVHSTNTLYRGSKVLSKPAVAPPPYPF
jgi:hypothetical protein